MFITAPEFPQAPHRINFKSGIAEVDDAVLKFVSSLPGLLVDQTLSITQVIEGTRPRNETIRTVIENYESVDAPVAAFEIPVGLQRGSYRETPQPRNLATSKTASGASPSSSKRPRTDPQPCPDASASCAN